MTLLEAAQATSLEAPAANAVLERNGSSAIEGRERIGVLARRPKCPLASCLPLLIWRRTPMT